MVKVLAAGDFHGNNVFTRTLAKKAVDENVDLVILCGDITEHGTEHREGLIAPFINAGKKVLLIPGNHDTFAIGDFLAELYGANNIHYKTVVYDNVGFVGCGGANVGMEALAESEIFEILRKGNDKVKDVRKKVFVTHIFPKDSLMDKMSHRAVPGSVGLSKAINELKPDVVFCSHAHEAEGVEEIIDGCRVICVGRSGKVIDL